MAAVHPHACGENNPLLEAWDKRAGTSPRMWGKLVQSYFGIRDLRYIPTHVGKTIRYIIGKEIQPVHPHACGENDVTVTEGELNVGTSPRMWGKPSSLPGPHMPDRYIPTHVGKTFGKAHRKIYPPVHPHACGENGISLEILSLDIGTSPRMWGKRRFARILMMQARYIPTHVGKTPTDCM